ncbi:cysteine protease XCP2 [Trifolium repens]|nr:cysteine protease XCP2 [Trifolium repens]
MPNRKKRVKKPISKRRHVKGESYEDTPNSLYWRNKRVVTGVRDQGNCGSFSSLSSSGAIEGVNAIVTGAGSGAGGRQTKGIGRGFDDGGARGAGGRGRGSQGGKPGGSRVALLDCLDSQSGSSVSNRVVEALLNW